MDRLATCDCRYKARASRCFLRILPQISSSQSSAAEFENFELLMYPSFGGCLPLWSYQSSSALELELCERHCISIERDRKSTRLNSSHVSISYAVFCLK